MTAPDGGGATWPGQVARGAGAGRRQSCSPACCDGLVSALVVRSWHPNPTGAQPGNDVATTDVP